MNAHETEGEPCVVCGEPVGKNNEFLDLHDDCQDAYEDEHGPVQGAVMGAFDPETGTIYLNSDLEGSDELSDGEEGDDDG